MNSPLNFQQKNIFLILGFARSGTSVTARSLKALGIDLGEDLVAFNHTNKWNPTGFWEDNEVLYNVHTKLYAALGHRMRGIRMIDPQEQTSDLVNDAKKTAIALLHERFLKTDYWGFKDPGTAKVLPFWQNIFDELNIQDHYIIALRNPLASAQSYARLTHSDIELCLLLWLMHLIPAVEHASKRNSIVVNYDSIIQEPKKQLERIKTILQIPSLSQPADIENFVNSFLNKDLNHYPSKDRSHVSSLVAPLCFDVYELLNQLARDEITFESTLFQTSWESIKKELEKIYPVYCYIDTILQRNRELKENIRKIEKSFIWKLLYPLRIIDDKLRMCRLKTRQKKRLITAYK